MTYGIWEKFTSIFASLSKYWLLTFFIAEIIYLELIFRLWIFKGISIDFIFPLLFALSAGAVLFILSSLFPVRINIIISRLLIFLLVLVYSVQLIYYSIFKTPLSFFSLSGAGDVLQFKDIILSAILKDVIAIILLFVPLVLMIFIGRRIPFTRLIPPSLYIALIFCIVSYFTSIICVNFTKENDFSQYTLYYKAAIPELSLNKLGLMTTMVLDFKRLVFGSDYTDKTPNNNHSVKNAADAISCIADTIEATPGNEVNNNTVSPTQEPDVTQDISYNILDIDFESLIKNEKNKTLLDMHKYFSSVEPTIKNKYTGIFKEYNLILITAESLSPYAISPELTPTLYKMSKEGFVFNNFYNPLWGVSTSDGEYVACTGLIPKSGIWSFTRSGKNYLPFVMGNQFGNLGYIKKAYHNHSYKYYNRHISHSNMGYDYKGIGNGLDVKETWPESDLEMIEVTAGEYIGDKPFHTYYMTVSGHMNYNFTGNYIARKNKSYVEHLPYSEASKAYIACNLELEFAMKALLDKLEEAGVADKTVIAISPDHYPYGLPKESIDELAGYKVENNFELYKSTFILWKKGMDAVTIDKPTSSLDIIPTLSNLFGLEYDSRLLMGNDALSEAPSLVIFSNRSWISDKATYNAASNTIKYTDGNNADTVYVKTINKIINDKFKYSAKILETDYYRKVINQNN